jgi:hypothetical protein
VQGQLGVMITGRGADYHRGGVLIHTGKGG